jgi:hypothetical protein
MKTYLRRVLCLADYVHMSANDKNILAPETDSSHLVFLSVPFLSTDSIIFVKNDIFFLMLCYYPMFLQNA